MILQINQPTDFTAHGLITYLFGAIILLSFVGCIWVIVTFTSKITILWDERIDKVKFEKLVENDLLRHVMDEHDKADREELKTEMKDLKKSIVSLEKQLYEKARVDSEIIDFMIKIESKIGK